MYAAEHGYTETVNALLAVPDIAVNKKNDDGITALMYAEQQGHTDVVDLLRAVAEKEEKEESFE